MKVDVKKGFRQGMLMFVPLIIGYLVGHFMTGLLIATGTLAHIYVFGGTAQAKLRIVIFCTLGLSSAMALGSLTANQPIIFGLLLLVISVVAYFIFSTFKIPGPSSIFFIVAYSLPTNFPVAPEEALYRGACMFTGGVLATIVVALVILFSRESAEMKAVQNDFNMIKQLVYNFDDPKAFAKASQFAVSTFRTSDDQLMTSSITNFKTSPRFQRLLLLHNTAQGIHSDLLELNESGARPLPNDIKKMTDFVIKLVFAKGQVNNRWNQTIDVGDEYKNLVDNIFKVDVIMNASDERLAHEVDIRMPVYGHRLLMNLNLESIVFRNTLRYIVIMAISIMIALLFDFDKAYWVPLSTHTILTGTHTLHSFERAGARGIGTIVGVLILSLILLAHPPIPVAILLLAISAGITEMIVGANYSYGVIFVTLQVLLLNGLASGHLTILNALPRVVDVITGIIIAVVCLLFIGRKTSSLMLPKTLAEVTRHEARLFHYIFSSNQYDSLKEDKKEMLKLSVHLNNMIQMYNSANGELSSDKKELQYYYPSIYALEEMSFIYTRALSNEKRYFVDDETMGRYLLIFENIAKHFERGTHIKPLEVPALPQYTYIRTTLKNIQNNCIKER